MLKSQSRVLIAGFVAIVLVTILFKGFLGLPYLRLPFVGAVAIFYVGFLLYTSDYLSESEATRLNRKDPGTVRRYKKDSTYLCAAWLSILILLIPTTALLVTMLLRQRELYEVPVLIQIAITFGGYIFLHLISWAFEIGPTYSIGYSETERRVNSIKRQREEQRHLREKRIREEAEFVVKQAVLEVLGVAEAEVTPSADMVNNLGCDCYDSQEILTFYDTYLSNTYHIQNPIEPPYGTVQGERMRRYDTIRMRYYSARERGTNIPEAKNCFHEQFLQIYPTIADQCEFLSGLIHYYRKD